MLTLECSVHVCECELLYCFLSDLNLESTDYGIMILLLFIFKDTLDAHFGRAILRVRSTASRAGCCAPKSFCRFGIWKWKQAAVCDLVPCLLMWVRNEKMIGKCYACRTICVAGTCRNDSMLLKIWVGGCVLGESLFVLYVREQAFRERL